MSTTGTYTDRMRLAQETWRTPVEARVRDAKAILSMVPTPRNGLLNPKEAFGQSARITRRLVEVNVEYFQDLAGAVRKHLSGLAGVLQDEIVTTAKVANDQAEKFEEAAIERAEEIRRTERAEARRARKAAHDAAAERYQDMTKVGLSEELGRRDLVKTGNVDELRERLIENDLQASM
jgi:hypothetical protein